MKRCCHSHKGCHHPQTIKKRIFLPLSKASNGNGIFCFLCYTYHTVCFFFLNKTANPTVMKAGDIGIRFPAHCWMYLLLITWPPHTGHKHIFRILRPDKCLWEYKDFQYLGGVKVNMLVALDFYHHMITSVALSSVVKNIQMQAKSLPSPWCSGFPKAPSALFNI